MSLSLQRWSARFNTLGIDELTEDGNVRQPFIVHRGVVGVAGLEKRLWRQGFRSNMMSCRGEFMESCDTSNRHVSGMHKMWRVGAALGGK